MQHTNSTANGKNLNPGSNKIPFDSSILAIDRLGNELESWDMLLTINRFKFLFDHSSEYLENAIIFLSKANFTIEQKNICVLTMQCLGLKDYIIFSKASIKLFNERKIPEIVLKNVIIPHFIEKNSLIKNLNNSEVKDILNEIIHNEGISNEFRKIVENILNRKILPK